MTYVEQLEIEKLSKETFVKITETVAQDDFINFYKTHTKQQTKDFYSINNDRTLKRILNFFNYDWSYHKSKKGKPSGRSHESYLNSGKKSAETQRQSWNEKSEEEKIKWTEKQKIAHSSDEFKTKIKQINIDYQANLSAEQKEEIKQKKKIANKKTWSENKIEILEKSYITKSTNNSWNTSTPEDRFYQYLLTKFDETDIIRQYKDTIRYPYCCDFYIKSKDLFIELNLSWTHGGHPYIESNEQDKLKLEDWKNKANNSEYYKNAIETWTVRDVNKHNAIKEHNLNYIEYYTEEDILNNEF